MKILLNGTQANISQSLYQAYADQLTFGTGNYPCRARYPWYEGQRYTCTVDAGHVGPHVAHESKDGKIIVLAVWDERNFP